MHEAKQAIPELPASWRPKPRKLRHEVFKRDGYRCRECRASKDETSLEIDHILPVAKGGTNDIDNLQTLCCECNRMKYTDTWVGGETDLKVAQNELINLEEQLQDAKIGLKNATNEDDKIDYQFKIVKLNEKIPAVKNKVDALEQPELKRIERKREKENENERKNKLFKKLYVQLNDDEIGVLSEYYGVMYEDKDKIIRFLVNNFHENGIYDVLRKYNGAQKKTDRWRRCGWGASQEAMDRWEKSRKS